MSTPLPNVLLSFPPISSFTSTEEVKEQLLDQPLRFAYDRKSYSQFYYTPQKMNPFQILLAKAAIISLAAAGIIGTVYYLAKTIFSVLTCLGQNKATLKANFFLVLRGLEFVGGSLVALFHDKLGAFLVQDAIFHRKCYQLYLKESPFVNKTRLTLADQAALKETLSHLSQMPSDQQQALINRLGFKVSNDFSKKLQSANPEVLNKVTIEDLKKAPQHIETWMLMSDEDFRDKTLASLCDAIPGRIIELIQWRATQLATALPAEGVSEDISKLPIVCFSSLAINRIHEAIQCTSISRELITKEQIQRLDVCNTPLDVIYNLFTSHRSDTSEKYFAWLFPRQVQAMLNIDEMRPNILRLISAKQFEELDLGRLDGYDVERLFPWVIKINDSDIHRLQAIPVEQLNKILPHLAEVYYEHLSDTQLLMLDSTIVRGEKRKKLMELIQTREAPAWQLSTEKWKDACEITLKRLKGISLEALETPIAEFKLSKHLELLGLTKEEFKKKLDATDSEALEHVSLKDFKLEAFSVQRWLLSHDTDFQNTPLAAMHCLSNKLRSIIFTISKMPKFR